MRELWRTNKGVDLSVVADSLGIDLLILECSAQNSSIMIGK